MADFLFEKYDMEAEKILCDWNEAQREAVTATEGFVRVIAGAGSGKTRALATRFAYLVEAVGILPENILCATFTNKAAAEMRARIKKFLGGNFVGLVCTFHSLCVSILQEDSNAVGYPKSFLVLDNADIDTMLRIIYDERGLTLRDKTFSDARDMFEMRKTKFIPNYYEDLIAIPLEALKEKYDGANEIDDILFYGYLYQQKKTFALDYNDLIVFVLHIFETNDAVRQKWQTRLEYIMVDEFQDIDEIQYRLMKTLCAYHKNLFVVGDPDQTIYSWRGADTKFLLDFDKNFSPTKTIIMNENFRSTQEILDAANSLISKNKNRIKKNLVAAKREEKISASLLKYHHAKKQEDEAKWICEQIKKLREGGAKYSDCAVLYRAHYVSRNLEEMFSEKKIPFTLYSGVQFFDREEIKDALSYLRLCVFGDDLSFRRIVNKPRRNIGKTRMEALEKFAEENAMSLFDSLRELSERRDEILNGTGAKKFIELIEKFSRRANEIPASELLGTLINESGYEKMLRTEGSQTRLDNLAELKQSVHDFEISCGEDCDAQYFLKRVALLQGLDAGGGIDAVKFMTVHTAKGLEFPHVFLCSLNEGIFPSQKTKTPFAMEEERRLCFVAATRAKETLWLSESEGRNLNGGIRYPSRFIFDIDKNFLEYTSPLSETFIATAKSEIENFDRLIQSREQTENLKAGDEITHAILGCGKILEVIKDDGAFLVKFEQISTPRKIRASAVKPMR